jgi:hypothetical protein
VASPASVSKVGYAAKVQMVELEEKQAVENRNAE